MSACQTGSTRLRCAQPVIPSDNLRLPLNSIVMRKLKRRMNAVRDYLISIVITFLTIELSGLAMGFTIICMLSGERPSFLANYFPSLALITSIPTGVYTLILPTVISFCTRNRIMAYFVSAILATAVFCVVLIVFPTRMNAAGVFMLPFLATAIISGWAGLTVCIRRGMCLQNNSSVDTHE